MTIEQVGRYFAAKLQNPALQDEQNSTSAEWTAEGNRLGFDFTEDEMLQFMKTIGGDASNERDELLQTLESDEEVSGFGFGLINFSSSLQEHLGINAEHEVFASFMKSPTGSAFVNTVD